MFMAFARRKCQEHDIGAGDRRWVKRLEQGIDGPGEGRIELRDAFPGGRRGDEVGKFHVLTLGKQSNQFGAGISGSAKYRCSNHENFSVDVLA